jgi:Rrf2 family protein
MAHIGNGAEYALHCLLYLVDQREGIIPSTRDLAEFQGISVSFLAKLFTKMEKADLVTAAEGARGGFQLARPASDISVLDVVDAVEGRKPLFDCKNIRANCLLNKDKQSHTAMTRGMCSIHAVMLQAEQVMRQSLAAQSLADIAETVAGKIPTNLQQATSSWFSNRSNDRAPGRRPKTTDTNLN